MGCGCCAGGQASELIQQSPSLLLDAFNAAPLLTLLVAIPILLALLLFYPLLILLTPKSTIASEKELHYSTYSNSSIPLPTLQDEASVQLSVIIPAFNERNRLEIMLKECVGWLEGLKREGKSLAAMVVEGETKGQNGNTNTNGNGNGNGNGKGKEFLNNRNQMNGKLENPFAKPLLEPLERYEIILVDDGSKDDTSQIALDFSKGINKNANAEAATRTRNQVEIRVVRLERNRGKGGAVRHGMMHSRGSQLLFADADGATKFSDLSHLCREMARIITPAGHGIVVGSRAHMVGSDAVVKRSMIRNFLMHSFHLLLSLLLRPPTVPSLWSLVPFLRPKQSQDERRVSLPRQAEIKDTQCGFKLFSRETAKLIFPKSHIERWIFDVELLLLAEMSCRQTLSGGLVVQRNRKGNLNRDFKSKSETGSRGGNDRRERRERADLNHQNQDGDEEVEEQDEDLLKLPLPISEIPVEWKEIGGSKINLMKDSIGMALDLCVIRANYALGRWERPGSVKVD